MALQITKPVTVNGWINLFTQAKTDGYTGQPIIREATVLNLNATVAYVHLTADGAANPATGTDGLPIGTTAATAPNSFITLPQGTDIQTVWIFTSGSQSIKYSVIGG